MVKSEKTIYFILAMVVISWGLNIVMVKYLTQFISPMLVAAIRMPLAGIVLLPFVFKKYGFYKPNAKQWGLLFLIGLTSIFFHQLFLAYGVVTTTATNASLILGLNPLTTALLASIFIGEKFSMRLGLGILFGFSGVVLVVTSKSADSSVGLSGWGDVIMLLSMLAYVVGALFIKKLSTTSMPTLVVTTYSTLIGGVMLNLGTVTFFGPSSYAQIHLPAMAWAVMLMSAWIASSLGTLGWNQGIKFLGANKTAMFLNGLPFASMVGGIIFLDEKIGWIHVVAFILTTVGIVIGTLKKRDSRLPSVGGKSVNT
ncbi:drug/metabolite transporter (DMT)-like permease [Paenibacillus sp. V4I7]|uniref:DMT family transporter n=1 Tax=Paenibacillus sp. V4I5 TaxID=3042306 RepID=UPI00277F486E|nr:DMT family transporter [Paenibacillus sp. V4I5]MDQ0902723.1 drug/metabolite transporter (DMT)-like permease [Paenibacillus sp. V4I7]MDQ0918765.1 drug/metabolite transporter (DMT)-like permease [Paenibacillus sp. V4I5]